MPEKDPTAWLSLWLLLKTSPTWQGALMAMFISLLRALYDDKEKRWVRIVLEALICGCLSLAASGVVEWLGLPPSMAIAGGGAIGFLGVTTVREMLLKWTGRKVEQSEPGP